MYKDQKEPLMLAVITKYRWPLLLVGALLLGFTVIFPQIGALQWVVLVPSLAVILTWLTQPQVKLRRMWVMGFCFFMTYYTVTFHWFLYMYPLDFAGFSKATSALVVCVAWLGLSAFQALGAAFLFPLMGLACRSKYLSRLPILHPFLFAALWTVLEWFQANSGWSGVPWGRLPLGQAEVLLTLQSSMLFGSYFVTFLLVAVNGLIAYGFIHGEKRRLASVLALSLLFGNLGFGVIRMAVPTKEGETATVASIQGNQASNENWGVVGSVEKALEIYAELTREAAAEGAQIVLWPETAIPSNIDKHKSVRNTITELADECDITILAGVFTQETDGEGECNSVVAALPDGTVHETVYVKRNLVPFGEFVPLRGLVTAIIPPLAEINTLGDDLVFGDGAKVIALEEGGVSPLICFDSIYERNALESVRDGAQLLAVPTNDSWFKDSRGVWMHHAQSQLRAIETGRYIMRAANTGVSSVITDKGEVMDYLGTFQTGYVLEEIQMKTYITPYTVIGNLFAYLCLTFCGGCVCLSLGEWMIKRKRKACENS